MNFHKEYRKLSEYPQDKIVLKKKYEAIARDWQLICRWPNCGPRYSRK